jgi:hypothetical protein
MQLYLTRSLQEHDRAHCLKRQNSKRLECMLCSRRKNNRRYTEGRTRSRVLHTAAAERESLLRVPVGSSSKHERLFLSKQRKSGSAWMKSVDIWPAERCHEPTLHAQVCMISTINRFLCVKTLLASYSSSVSKGSGHK